MQPECAEPTAAGFPGIDPSGGERAPQASEKGSSYVPLLYPL